MAWVGFIMVVMSVVAIYLYYKKQAEAKGGSGLSEHNQAAVARAAELKALKKSEAKLELDQVQEGGILQLQGVGPMLEDLDVQVVGRHLCKAGTKRWWELEGDVGGRIVTITLDGSDISFSGGAIELAKLGLGSEDLQELQQRQEPLEYGGEKYYFEAAGVATYCANGNEMEPENYQYWEFETESSDSFLTVSRWSNGEVEVYQSSPVRPQQVNVYSLSGPLE